MLSPFGGALAEESGGDFDEYQWAPYTCELAVDYAKLQLEVPGATTGAAAASARYLPCCPVTLRGNVLTLALPADAVVWLSPHLVPLGDDATGLPAAEGHTVAVAIVRCDHGGGVVLMQAQQAYWVDSGQ